MGAIVSEFFFYKDSKSKTIFFFFGGGVGQGGMRGKGGG